MASSHEYQTNYQPFDSEDESPEIGLLNEDHAPQVHYSSITGNQAKWTQVPNLDDFFIRIYSYYWGHGFFCMLLDDLFQLGQFIFIIFFTGFLSECVNYDVLFATRPPSILHTKQTFADVINTDCKCGFGNGGMTIFMVIGLVFLVIRTIRKIVDTVKNWEIRSFYKDLLNLDDEGLANITWPEVLEKLIEVQREIQMCIHKTELTELDIYHRILRFKNYTTAMVNKNVLPLKVSLPCLGKFNYLSNGLKYNLELILYYGPFGATPFEAPWTLRADYKNVHRRELVTQRLARLISLFALINLLLSPIILLWGILYLFFQYGELLKREPGYLGSRMWSLFAKPYLRHFNEPDHELRSRLNRGVRVSREYLSGYTSPPLCILAKNVRFVSGSILIVLVLLTVYDEDTLQIENMITLMTGLGVICGAAQVLIPPEDSVYDPEALMQRILLFTHYQPDSWRGKAHTKRVRSEFGEIFQYKAVYLLYEILSPVITPLYLLFVLRPRAGDIVNFLRNFTVEVQGVGDVCSFALMDVKRHGSPTWSPADDRVTTSSTQAELGKTELSLMHFALANPNWKPPADSDMYLKSIRQRVQADTDIMEQSQEDTPLSDSLHTAAMVFASPSAASVSSPVRMSASVAGSRPASTMFGRPRRSMNGSAVEGTGILDPLARSSVAHQQLMTDIQLIAQNPNQVDEISLSVIYLHELHHRHQLPTLGYETLDESSAPMASAPLVESIPDANQSASEDPLAAASSSYHTETETKT